jgi:hypothetical protein
MAPIIREPRRSTELVRPSLEDERAERRAKIVILTLIAAVVLALAVSIVIAVRS